MTGTGTIAWDVHYCSCPEDFELFLTAAEAIRELNIHGYIVVVVTNQSGIARGYFSEATLDEIHEKMLAELGHSGARVDAIYYCPHHPDEECECRKPGVALFTRAAADLAIDLGQSFVVGDMQSDIDAGRKLGCRTVLVTTDPKRGHDVTSSPDFTADSLLEATRWVLGQVSNPKGTLL